MTEGAQRVYMEAGDAASPAALVRGDGDSDQAGGSGEGWRDSRYVLVVKSKGLGCPRYTADGEGGTETKFRSLTRRAGWMVVVKEYRRGTENHGVGSGEGGV